MKTKKAKSNNRKTKIISYRMKCTKTANGLSHYVMYGDKKNSLL
jgi:hypothetical protein